MAFRQDDLAALRHVLDRKGDPNCGNAAGWTPLILSAMADRTPGRGGWRMADGDVEIVDDHGDPLVV